MHNRPLCHLNLLRKRTELVFSDESPLRYCGSSCFNSQAGLECLRYFIRFLYMLGLFERFQRFKLLLTFVQDSRLQNLPERCFAPLDFGQQGVVLRLVLDVSVIPRRLNSDQIVW